jgi:hypothetical protein
VKEKREEVAVAKEVFSNGSKKTADACKSKWQWVHAKISQIEWYSHK